MSKHDDSEYRVTSKVEGDKEPMVQQVFGPRSKKKAEEHIDMAHAAHNKNPENDGKISKQKVERIEEGKAVAEETPATTNTVKP